MAISSPTQASPFLHCGSNSESDSLAILHLKRDLLIPTVLRSHDDLNEGYSEGKVSNTRFGSFPHSTLIGVPWGSQVRASAVDTGSRGRKGWEGKGKKRKRDEDRQAQDDVAVEEKLKPEIEPKAAVDAATGFVHLLPPTPEIWTASLPHRTQVVYTPDYSYILHRLRARPGTVLIEAGAGSGSFTHAAARAVYNGYPNVNTGDSSTGGSLAKRWGKVWSFEFHEQRAQKLQEEIKQHGLDGIVEVTHRDACKDGFTPNETPASDLEANAVFLDLPAPWLALKNLARASTSSPLSRTTAIHLCTFSPCIEQVQRTITALRVLGWTEIDMVEIAAHRIEVRRERVGLAEEGLRGVNDSPASVDEAVGRLREVEGRSRIFHNEGSEGEEQAAAPGPAQVSKQQRLESIRNALEGRKLFKEGRLIHKAEQELKTHTSYLVFAVLPREWSEEDEKLAQEKWPAKVEVRQEKNGPVGRRQKKKEAKAKAGGNKEFEMAATTI
ncbi:tRNA (adenine-N(1)-)-methyltransferase catalytic subunit trm61 [Imshaugia aleurites]|uniref:tRNA (adenine(58)-N(1))-methyltransferase catalytic subunit TRM61 n=1 Tax=Imshaugia aleurites TaxID=172621 RepID=A0A8H3GAF6_9LECA|nr:tRNA (adenine-N(1)-)-methyltransferase catalytic subunit trm61 [Imshaugia aleurites]